MNNIPDQPDPDEVTGEAFIRKDSFSHYDKRSPVRLRPHHLLCLQNFRGKGYSPGFVRKMMEISALLQRGPVPPALILLVSGADDLCSCCPHCVSGRCTSANPDHFDSLVLAYTGFSSGSLLPDGLLSDSIPVMTESLLESCCPGCSWMETCREIVTAHPPVEA